MRQQAMSSKMIFNRPIPVNRLVSSIADSKWTLLFPRGTPLMVWIWAEAQVNTQEYGRRPYGVGFLVIGQDNSGPHLYEFSPSGNSFEYYAMSIGARSQSAKTYLEKHYEEFADCVFSGLFTFFHVRCLFLSRSGALEDLVRHGLHALRETLQQDKELNVNNTSIGIIGPKSEHETSETPGGAFRILENEAVEPFLHTMRSKEDLKEEERKEAALKAAEAAPAAGDDDVQMSG